MLDLDHWHEILSTLRRNALRTALTAIGVFWGVFMLIVMVGFGNGLERGVHKSMSGLATNSIYIWGQRTSVPYDGLSPGRYVGLTIEDAESLYEIAGVTLVAPRVSLGGRRSASVVTRNGKSGDFSVMGDLPAYLQVQPMTFLEGRFLNELDVRKTRKVAVIGTRVAEGLFNPGEPVVGGSISIKGIEFVVVGLFASRQTGDRGEDHAATVYTPLTTFQRALSPSRKHVDYIAVLSDAGTRGGDIEGSLVRSLGKRHRVSPEDKQAIGSFNADEEFQKIVGLFTGISLLIWLVGSVTLLAGFVGVSNIMMVSVRERTREIGIRKAIGATPRVIVGQIMLESTVLTSVAGYLGLVVGVGVLEIIGRFVGGDGAGMFDVPEVSLATALVATAAVSVGGAVAGMFPALRAVSIRTVTALREE
jgi:putative ABC transport system permease protein